ncbi:MAG: hypothetical protein D6721_06550 [Gammaproteobacteria bacterium]|nr:MAG: hypothetical protein D6721_06550 [Gammaproteobacteria bacterium]
MLCLADMFTRLRRHRRGITGASLVALAAAWLTFFCGHCLALGTTAPDAVTHCIHEHVGHDCCSKGDHACHHGDRLQAVPVPDGDLQLPGTHEVHSAPVALWLQPAVFAHSPFIRAGPRHARPYGYTPPRYLLHRVLRD